MPDKTIAFCAQGALRGLDLGDVRAFLGVPFAKPPVGALRWREPQPPAAWRGARDARFYRAAPLQPYGSEADGLETAWLDEDCLYLNIWTPAEEPGRTYPVYVWYYGGSYQGGRADDPSFNGAELAKKGIVAVTVNYRVNIFGFLCHPDMCGESPYGTGGNFGLLDQIESLKWLSENLPAFGGDPARITIGGQSAGSASVNNLICSPLSRGLIAGAINQSGDVLQPERDLTFDMAAEGGVRLCESFGVKTLNELRALPAETFIRLNYDAMGERIHSFATPVIDGVVIPYSQGNMLLRNDCAPVPILLGSNFDEGSGGGPGYVERVCDRLGVSPELYPDAEPARARALARDYWYGRHLAWARIRTEDYGLPLWHYVYARQDGARGAQHGAEIPYVFRNLVACETGRRSGAYTDADYALMELMSGYWLNFIKTGDPNGEGLPYWPKKTSGVGHLRFDLESRMEDDLMRPEDGVICPAVYRWLKRRASGESER